jgi:tetratricopeptide (TPR) repeat protein
MRGLSILKLFLVIFLSVSLLSPLLVAASPAVSAPSQPRSSVEAKSLQLNENAVEAIKKKDFARAEELLRRALEVDPRNVTAAFNLASTYLTLNKNADAITLLKAYLAKSPSDPGLHARMGDALFATKDVKGAIESYEAALKIEPHYLGIKGKLATLYTLTHRLPEAEKALLAAVDEDPQNGAALGNLSALFLANNKPNEAVSTAKRALQVNPTSGVYVTMGSAYEAMKDYKNALIAFERAHDLGNKSPELQTKIEELKKVVS